MAKLAFYTYICFPRRNFQALTQQRFRRQDRWRFESAEQASGFVGRADSARHEGQDAQWGDPLATPRFNARQRDARRDNSPEVSPDDHEAATLSLWDDLESVYAFAYYGRHAEALKKREDWFVKPEWPSVVAWWRTAGSPRGKMPAAGWNFSTMKVPPHTPSISRHASTRPEHHGGWTSRRFRKNPTR